MFTFLYHNKNLSHLFAGTSPWTTWSLCTSPLPLWPQGAVLVHTLLLQVTVLPPGTPPPATALEEFCAGKICPWTPLTSAGVLFFLTFFKMW